MLRAWVPRVPGPLSKNTRSTCDRKNIIWHLCLVLPLTLSSLILLNFCEIGVFCFVLSWPHLTSRSILCVCSPALESLW